MMSQYKWNSTLLHIMKAEELVQGMRGRSHLSLWFVHKVRVN